ncbi:MAG: YHYH protein [Saprospiraceae bacterium]|nr:YHYH protein [Saprospiraceae bacterium]
MRSFFVFALLSFTHLTNAQITPEISSWILNTTGATGYNNIPSNVQKVQYSDSNVYVSASCIPGYDIGPWQGNPNIPKNQNFVFKITRFPKANNNTPISTGLGHIGVWTNGVSIFNPKDGMSYNNQNVWNQNAIVVEGPSFDNCLGHPAPNGEYHHHLNPRCLYNDTLSTLHAPIIGYAFDGFPVYGAFGYSNKDGTGGIRRMQSSYQIRNIIKRNILPNGMAASSAGPDVSTRFPLGYYVEDYEFVQGSGDLDEHNGRFCVTPEYPKGIYAYFVSLDSNLIAAYPYVLGTSYYGLVPTGNTGPGSGHNTIRENVTSYNGTTQIDETVFELKVILFENPANSVLSILVNDNAPNNLKLALLNVNGQIIHHWQYLQASSHYVFDVSGFETGMYYLKIYNESFQQTKPLQIIH